MFGHKATLCCLLFESLLMDFDIRGKRIYNCYVQNQFKGRSLVDFAHDIHFESACFQSYFYIDLVITNRILLQESVI
jgi:hypothetical protein